MCLTVQLLGTYRICGRQTWRINKTISRDRNVCCTHVQLRSTGDSTVLNVR